MFKSHIVYSIFNHFRSIAYIFMFFFSVSFLNIISGGGGGAVSEDGDLSDSDEDEMQPPAVITTRDHPSTSKQLSYPSAAPIAR